MGSSCNAFPPGNGETLQLEGQNTNTSSSIIDISPFGKRPSSISRRTHSFSWSSSCRSSSSSSLGSPFFDDNSTPSSPITPLRFSGIPFSWEQHPGIPKKYFLNIPPPPPPPPHSPSSASPSKTQKEAKVGSLVLLPLPPPNPTPSKRFDPESIRPARKKKSQDNFHPDPFVAALMECSKDHTDGVDDCWKQSRKASRTLSDRITGFVDLHYSCRSSCDVTNSTVFIPKSSRGRYQLLNHRKV